MRFSSRIASIALSMAACASASVAMAQVSVLSPEEIYAAVSPSVWLVRGYDADGLAFVTGSAVVTGHETLLTNCHVLSKAKRLVIRNDNVQHDAKLQHIDVVRDLCQITARNLRAPAVELGDSDRLSVGQRVFALGNPRGLELTLSDGLVSALRKNEDNGQLVLIQTSAPISHGSSGGGLFDTSGRLIGITTLITRDAQNLNFAIPINWRRELAARSDAALRAANPARAETVASAPTGAATLGEPDAVPGDANCKTEYTRYIAAALPKAFAISSTNGRCAWQQSRRPNRPQVSSSPDPAVRAMELCVHWYGTGCSLYAVDSAVVFKR